MKKLISFILTIIFSLSFLGCTQNSNKKEDLKNSSWETILKESKGTTVSFYGWGGSEATNKWIDNYLAKELKNKYDINLKRVPMDIDNILNKLLGEKQANNDKGTIDVVWINGENFLSAKKNSLLYGPFTNQLPNMKKYVNQDGADIKMDFGQPTEGYEAPYGKAQFVMVYDGDKVKSMPKDYKAFMELAKANPGKLTYPAPPDFTGSAFVRNIIYDMVGYEKFTNMKADKETVQKEIQPAINYLKELKPYLWNKGKTYPANIAMLDNLYSEKAVINTMSYNPNSITQKMINGSFSPSTQTSVFDKGTIGNTHFLAIPYNSQNKPAAMAVIDFILSYEVQSSKYKPEAWGDLPVFDNNKLSQTQKEELKKIKLGAGVLPQDVLLNHRVPEMPANLVPIIEKIWQENITKED